MSITDFHSLLDMGSVEGPDEPPVLTGEELQELLAPLTADQFVDTYFSRQSLSLDGAPEKFSHLFGWGRLKQALARGRTIRDKRFNVMASFAGGEEAGSRKPMFEASLGQVTDLLGDGATICITNIHMADPFLARWAQAIRRQLSFTGTVGVNCYVSPDGAGLPMHYDKRVATTLQIAGKKRWKYSTEAAKPWPDHNATFQQGKIVSGAADPGKPPADMTFEEVELSPGDLLCLPAGAWHSARGIGVSLALNLYFAPRNFLDQLTPLLMDFAVSSDEWRGGPPATLDPADGKVPESVSAYMRGRLDEFYSFARALIDDPDAVDERWLNALSFAPYTGWRPDPEQALPKVTQNSRFRVARQPLNFIEKSGTVIVPSDQGLLNFSEALAPILRRLSSEADGATLTDILSWQEGPDAPSPRDIIPLLQSLYKNGLLEIV